MNDPLILIGTEGMHDVNEFLQQAEVCPDGEEEKLVDEFMQKSESMENTIEAELLVASHIDMNTEQPQQPKLADNLPQTYVDILLNPEKWTSAQIMEFIRFLGKLPKIDRFKYIGTVPDLEKLGAAKPHLAPFCEFMLPAAKVADAPPEIRRKVVDDSKLKTRSSLLDQVKKRKAQYKSRGENPMSFESRRDAFLKKN